MKDGIHLYAKVAREIRHQIDNGTYQEGDRLPSERKLCETFEASRITIRQALELLEDQRVIVRKHGVGTYVLPSQYNQILDNLYSFKDEIEKSGETPSTKMIDIELVKVDDYLQEKMGLPLNSTVYKLSRIRLADNVPLVLEHSYIPAAIAPELDRFNFSRVSLYQTLKREYGIEINKSYETLKATKLNKEEAERLQKENEDIAMYIQRFAYKDGGIIEYTRSIVAGDKYKYTVELI